MPVPIPRNHSSYKWKFASLDPYLSISSTPQPLVTTCYSLFLWVWLYFKISQISEHTVFVFFSLAYFTSIISSRLIHVVTNGRIFFFVMAKEFPLYVYTYPTFYPFIHSLASTLVVSISWLLWMRIQWHRSKAISSIQILFPSDIYPEVGLLDPFWGHFDHLYSLGKKKATPFHPVFQMYLLRIA